MTNLLMTDHHLNPNEANTTCSCDILQFCLTLTEFNNKSLTKDCGIPQAAHNKLTVSSKFCQKKAVFLSCNWRSIRNGKGLVSPLWHIQSTDMGFRGYSPTAMDAVLAREGICEFLQWWIKVQRRSFANMLVDLSFWHLFQVVSVDQKTRLSADAWLHDFWSWV